MSHQLHVKKFPDANATCKGDKACHIKNTAKIEKMLLGYLHVSYEHADIMALHSAVKVISIYFLFLSL